MRSRWATRLGSSEWCQHKLVPRRLPWQHHWAPGRCSTVARCSNGCSLTLEDGGREGGGFASGWLHRALQLAALLQFALHFDDEGVPPEGGPAGGRGDRRGWEQREVRERGGDAAGGISLASTPLPSLPGMKPAPWTHLPAPSWSWSSAQTAAGGAATSISVLISWENIVWQAVRRWRRREAAVTAREAARQRRWRLLGVLFGACVGFLEATKLCWLGEHKASKGLTRPAPVRSGWESGRACCVCVSLSQRRWQRAKGQP